MNISTRCEGVIRVWRVCKSNTSECLFRLGGYWIALLVDGKSASGKAEILRSLAPFDQDYCGTNLHICIDHAKMRANNIPLNLTKNPRRTRGAIVD